MNWRILRGWVIVLVILGGGIAALQFLLSRPEVIDVRIYRMKRGLVEETVTSTKAGSVRSRQAADLSVEVPGLITAVHAREGAKVQKGAPLISLDKREAQQALAMARQEVESARKMLLETKARWDDAVREHNRVSELRKTESIAQAQVDQAETLVKITSAAHESAEARIDFLKTSVDRASLLVQKCDLYAPFDGTVAQLLVEVGEWAVPGKMILRLINPEQLYVRAEIDEVDMGSVREGLDVRVTLDPFKGREFSGKITRVAPYVTEVMEQNRTVVIEVELSQLDGIELRQGISADVEVILNRKDAVLRVPTLALMEGQRVLVVGPDQVARRVQVKIGIKNWQYAEIVDGLKEQDPVIVSLESEKVKEGVRVRVTQESER